VPGFEQRGVIEGFYGTPWSHEDRLWVVERIGGWGMNRYVYAPKEDPLHRERWREPYPSQTLARFRELVERGARAGVEVGFAVSPGLSIRYASGDDRAALAQKLSGFRELGARHFTLSLDDVPSELSHAEDRRAFASLAEAHAALAHELLGALGEGARLCLVPTDYLGVEPTDYLETLGTSLDPAVGVGWTGRTIVSPTIERAEAARRAATLRRRPLVVWDNTPVSDGPMRALLHLGPYVGRAPELPESVSGILLNPMEHARASAITLRTAAAYLAAPASYDPEKAWSEAIEELAEGAAGAFDTFARAHRFSALAPDDRDRELEAALCQLRRALERERDAAASLAELEALLAERRSAAERIREGLRDRRLATEIEPWLVSHARETRRIEAALGCLNTLLGDATRSAQTFAFMGMEARLARETDNGKASYGPRRVLYPQLGSMREDAMGFGRDPALFVDRCLADEFVALAEKLALTRLVPAR
jgi:hyaluronoglucosaminidase